MHLRLLQLRGEYRDRDLQRRRAWDDRSCQSQRYGRSSPGRASFPGSGGCHLSVRPGGVRHRDEDRRCLLDGEHRRVRDAHCRPDRDGDHPDRDGGRLDAGQGADHRCHRDGAFPDWMRRGYCPGAGQRDAGQGGGPPDAELQDAVPQERRHDRWSSPWERELWGSQQA